MVRRNFFSSFFFLSTCFSTSCNIVSSWCSRFLTLLSTRFYFSVFLFILLLFCHFPSIKKVLRYVIKNLWTLTLLRMKNKVEWPLHTGNGSWLSIRNKRNAEVNALVSSLNNKHKIMMIFFFFYKFTLIAVVYFICRFPPGQFIRDPVYVITVQHTLRIQHIILYLNRINTVDDNGKHVDLLYY